MGEGCAARVVFLVVVAILLHNPSLSPACSDVHNFTRENECAMKKFHSSASLRQNCRGVG